MQEVSATKTSDRFDLLRSSAYSDAAASQSRAFADFIGLMSQVGAGVSAMNANAQSQRWSETPQRLDNSYSTDTASSAVNTVSTVSTQAAPVVAAVSNTQTTVQASTQATGTQTAQTRQFSTDASQTVAKNAPVSREAFEEARPILVKAGLSDTEIEDLRARSQTGSLTWGQLVQSVSGHMTGAKKAVKLTTSETQDLQLMFQKMGYGVDQAQQMVARVASGETSKVMAGLQEKLSGMSDDTSLGMDKNQLATFFKAMRVPQATADKLTQALGPESTVADLKNALATMGQALKEQQTKTGAEDAQVAKALGKIMGKDVAKATRDASQATSTQASSGGSANQVAFELKTKDKNDTSWFGEHEQNQQKKPADEPWREFNAKVRVDDATARTAAQSSQAAQSGQTQNSQNSQTSLTGGKTGADALDALAGRTGLSQAVVQGKAETSQAAKAFDKVAAPKVLDQVQEAMLKDLGQGRKQLTVQLDPEDLGKLNVMLQVKGKEVTAVLKAEDPQTANMLTANLESIKKTLEDQGLKVQSLEVQTGLTQSQDQQAQFTADQHNQAQERQELSRMMSQLRMLRTDSADMAQDMQNVSAQAILADHGLHIIA